MASEFMYLCSLVVFLSFLSNSSVHSSSTNAPSSSSTSSNAETTTIASTATLHSNVTKPNETKGFVETLKENKGMLMRAFYVLIGVTAIVVVYFGVRAWRLRRKRNKTKKYGLISGRGADYEMAPLDADDDDDDEDTTVFEMNRRKK